jgi:hypothetical protein
MFPVIEKTLSTGADVPGKDIGNLELDMLLYLQGLGLL